MKHYEIISVERHQGQGQEAFDASRIGKHVYAKGFEVGAPALLFHEEVEGRVMMTSPLLGYTNLSDGVELRTTNTTYTLREIILQ